MPTNVLLVRWSGGWHERGQPGVALDEYYPRRVEGTLGIGSARSISETNHIADKQLEIFANERAEVSCTVEPPLTPLDAIHTPYLGFNVGDSMPMTINGATSNERVVSVTVTEDEEGFPQYAMTWKDLITVGQEAYAQWLKKMANGTLSGRSAVASPVSDIPPPPPSYKPTPIPPFSLPGAVTISESGRYYPPSGASVSSLQASVDTPGTTNTTAAILVDGVIKGTVTIPAGESAATNTVAIQIPSGSHVKASVTSAGSGATNLTVQLK